MKKCHIALIDVGRGDMGGGCHCLEVLDVISAGRKHYFLHSHKLNRQAVQTLTFMAPGDNLGAVGGWEGDK